MRLILLALALVAATPAAAQLRAVPAQPASEAAALRGVEVFLINEGDAPVDAEGPREIEVTATDGTRLVLERLPMAKASVAPGAFVKVRYVPVGIAGIAVPPASAHPPAEMASGKESETTVSSSTGSSSAFVDRFEPHEPIYGAFGTGDSGAKLQVSFAFRPFAEDAPVHLGNLRFAYTQTMFWHIEQPSGPFTSTNYSPEIYADLPVDDHLKFALGVRHDSNGRGTARSIDANRVYLRAQKTFDLGGDWRLDVAPQAWVYVGEKGIATDLKDYWGYSSLTAAIQQKDGLKVSLTGRGSFKTGRGAAELFVSYPLTRLGGLGFYIFGQAFTGYGEAMDDYRVNDTHARIGIALTR
jgi:hypothetical protein